MVEQAVKHHQMGIGLMECAVGYTVFDNDFTLLIYYPRDLG